METLLPTLVIWQNRPDIALMHLSGIVIPPHQRTTLYALNYGAQNNVNVSSRATSKSSTVATLHASHKALLFPNRTGIILSYTGFRGGQLVMGDTERWVTGAWSSQKKRPLYVQNSLRRDNIINKSQNFWEILFKSGNSLKAFPTNDPDKLRGIRGTDLFFDEANFIGKYLMDVVAVPFLSVKGDFEHGGLYADPNQIYYTSTIDYEWRPFMEEVRVAKEALRREMLAIRAVRDKDQVLYDEYETKGLFTHSFVSFDYTDCLIRTEVVSRKGKRFKVRWPNPSIEARRDPRGIPFSKQLADGRMARESSPLWYYPTYPVDKSNIENKLLQGTQDENSWLSENRNIVDTSVGDVYSHSLIDKASCREEFCIQPYIVTSKEYQAAFPQQDYCSPLLWNCTDPCVLGVDYATQSDFSAFVVIRMGPCAEGEYNYITHHGKTRWSNVIWAEQHKHTSHEDVAEKIRELMTRYNLVYHFEAFEEDPWKRCRAIGLDMRGGGSGVRDNLAYINTQSVELPKFRIYDPQDKDPRIPAFALDPHAKPMLDAIWPQGDVADKMVTFTVAQMETGLMYIPKYLQNSQRPNSHAEMDIGYYAAANLAHQMVKLRQEHTSTWRRFYMEGDTEKDINKKDLWSAFMYAAKQLRAHLIRKQMIDETPPPIAARVVQVNSGRGGMYGGVPGTKNDFRGMRRL